MLRIVIGMVLLLSTAAPSHGQLLDVRELTTTAIDRLDRSKTAVLLVDGILEQHGPYLPAFSDGYQAEFVAARVADAIVARPGWTVLRFPTIPLGTWPASEIGRKWAFPGSYPVRFSTVRAVFMDLATDLGEAGFKWVFILNAHGGPTHNRALDQAAQFFNDTYGGRMVHVTGLAGVVGAAPRDLFTSEQRAAEGFSVHADADEHSRVLFMRPDLVPAEVRTAPPVVTRTFDDIVATAERSGWTGYFGTPAIANADAGRRAMTAIAQSAVNVVLKVLDGGPDEGARVADRLMADPGIRRVVDRSLEHEREIEKRQTDWLARQPR
jgi:creatinine amidohydrolase/Fe(II)-dependent formamide hydrolase-like protein